MKIRFMKRLTVEDLDKHFIADGGKVIFSSCDQVQMKLTQLELSSVRLITSSDSLGELVILFVPIINRFVRGVYLIISPPSNIINAHIFLSAECLQ